MKLLLSLLVLGVAGYAAAQLSNCEVHGELTPNPADCNTFYQCSYGHLFLHTCPEGLTYHPALQRCDYPSDQDSCAKDAKAAAATA